MFQRRRRQPDGGIERITRRKPVIPLAIRKPRRRFGAFHLRRRLSNAGRRLVRDYVHVSDLARAHVAAVGDLLNGGSSFAVNLGTGRGQSVFEVVNAVSKVAGKDVPYVVSPRRPGDPAALVADVAAAKARLGFEADYRDIEAIVETAWDWHATRRPKITTG